MHILTTSTGSQELKVIPRYYQDDITMRITGENSRVTTITEWVDPTEDNGYMVINAEFNLSEGLYYGLEISTINDTLLYRGRIFCTDQSDFTSGRYDTNLNEYTSSNAVSNIIIF